MHSSIRNACRISSSAAASRAASQGDGNAGASRMGRGERRLPVDVHIDVRARRQQGADRLVQGLRVAGHRAVGEDVNNPMRDIGVGCLFRRQDAQMCDQRARDAAVRGNHRVAVERRIPCADAPRDVAIVRRREVKSPTCRARARPKPAEPAP